MIRLWWVRHAPVRARGLAGARDVPSDLSDRAALDRLARFLPDAPIFTSSLRRTIETARAISEDRPILAPIEGLREFDFGAWEGLTPDEIAARDPALSRAFWSDPTHVHPPGGESWVKVSTRVEDALKSEVLPQIQGLGRSDAIIVSHFGVISTRIARAAGLGARETLAHPVHHLSVTRIDHDLRTGAERLVFAGRMV